ncbi:hypothetical protein HMPREF9318_00568 [Streptococcus urinalis FB127-CNA-2]|uniref:Amidase n=1 Tax=Streptococcus urinalis 2285-97 TaxID=764291 RepID=G5KGK2_9STRE|nr:amidase [Streptococcus urinalis]EHJ55807.1 amidase [Streptococcus urinalis 2285-97]EKS22370.1 hypothetical protein HMPREF9318_00568 [Streptococcus urinalis FB127-CNA-2]VEF32183.1 amidase [Streptococcus urinalis]
MNFKDATEMAEAVRTHQVSATELVYDVISKVEKVNSKINAITSERYEKAIAESRKRVYTDQPFAGVPIFLKDLGQNLKGDHLTSGSQLFKDHLATKTDHYVKRLEELGFLFLGRTNTPEFGFKNISDSQLNGLVNLPDDVTRNAGGSSGGAAALVSSGCLPISAASDGGGSIRIPASFNGLIGLKPSRGRIPTGPDSYRAWQGASVHFALTKSVRDTKNLLYYLQDCQYLSPYTLPKISYEELFSPLDRYLKIGMVNVNPDGSSIPKDAQKALEEAKHFLERNGHKVSILDKAPVDNIALIKNYYQMNGVETAAMFDQISLALGREMTKDDMEIMTWAIYQCGQQIKAKTYSQLLDQWDIFHQEMSDFYHDYDLLLTITTNTVAPKQHSLDPEPKLLAKLQNAETFNPTEQEELIWQMFEKSLAVNPYTSQANLTGQPAISLPTYRDESGLAMGLQFISPKGKEALLLQVAQLFEENGLFK